ncbi:superoxide dismutase [Cu-Zn]-like isoform X2 [Xenia sp. Carnegie-2017]|nr:superoxide dismutase [Cu-Zn]-like isoform X2 [Xenia sp. Carnegie-2017]
MLKVPTTFMKINIKGLIPNSVHGFHIHEYGDIVTKGCQSTGGHFNPHQQMHGAPMDYRRHVGDLGNVYADNKGEVKVIKRDVFVSLVGELSVLGRAFVLHEQIDDLGRGGNIGSLKTGNAGKRIACGVIVRTPDL